MEDFDKALLDSLINDRHNKFKKAYNIGGHNDLKNSCEYDSDQERNDAYQMFVNDYQTIRQKFIGYVDEIGLKLDQ